MTPDLSRLRETLLCGIKLSMQSSYGRKSPANVAIPHLEQARKGLRILLAENPNNAEGWKLLSQAEECLLQYSEAVECLKKAMELTKGHNKKDQKRLAMLKECCSKWRKLILSPIQLQKLGEFLIHSGVNEEIKGRTLQFTWQWLVENQILDPQNVIAALGERGAFSDFQVLYNVVRG